MRKTAGKEAYTPITKGDPRLSDLAALALMANGDVDRFSHGFHTYPAGLHPDAAAILIEGLGGDSLLDPFCGGGTTLVEGRAKGLRTHGRDVSPTAIRVAKARTFALDEELATKFRSRSRLMTKLAQEEGIIVDDRIEQALTDWYAPCALEELSGLMQGLEESDADIYPLLEACLSSIMVKTSWRRSDTSAQRVIHRRPPTTTAILFHKKCRELARKLLDLSATVPEGTPDADIQFGDARSSKLQSRVDLIVTSPPYPSTYDYLPMQHLRRVWFDDRRVDKSEVGARRYWREHGRQARKRWVDDTRRWTDMCAKSMTRGAHMAVVIGDGLEPKGTVDTLQITLESAKEAGLETAAYSSVNRIDHARESNRWEHILIFRK